MNELPSREIRRQRWLDFADFMENLPEHKFEHGSWCRPDHTCKTTACVAGWGAIRYSEKMKNWLNLTFEKQVINLKLSRARSEKTINTLYEEGCAIDRKIDSVYVDWERSGKEALYLTHEMAKMLFYPSNNFWFTGRYNETQVEATNKDIALIFRYLAALPTKTLKLPRQFNREKMQKTIDYYNSKKEG